MSVEQAGPDRPRRRLLAFLPLAVFVALAGIFMVQLLSGKDASELPSVLIGKPAPDLQLEPLAGLVEDGRQVPGIDGGALAGRPYLLNVFASWCVPCRQEHPMLMELASEGRIALVGINYKDKTGNALEFLESLGNPYDRVGVDPKGRAAIEWGVYGIPETFIVGADGTILYKHVGPFDRQSFEEELVPAIARATDGG